SRFKRTKNFATSRVCAERSDIQGPTMKIIFRSDDFCLVYGHPFHAVGPTAANVKCSFNSFFNYIHRQYFVVAKKLSDEFCIWTELIVMKRTRGERQNLSLL